MVRPATINASSLIFALVACDSTRWHTLHVGARLRRVRAASAENENRSSSSRSLATVNRSQPTRAAWRDTQAR